ncbi:MAG: virulence RhuM family protein [Chlamydiales bacterium]|nr:virulence RhuM family protein [Chlamydiales bacterium]
MVQKEGNREIIRNIEFYNLESIIAVGSRVNSTRAIQFRQWATGILRDFTIRGYLLDKDPLKNGAFFNEAYFDSLFDKHIKYVLENDKKLIKDGNSELSITRRDETRGSTKKN